MPDINVSLPDQLKVWLDERIKEGSFPTVSDYLRDLIRRDREQRDALIAALVEGEESGVSQRTVREIVAAAKSKLLNGES